MVEVFLHEVPYHVHRTLGVLQIVSWIVIAVGGAALVLSWGRIIAWLKEDETVRRPKLVRWGEDDGGWFAELRNAPRGMAWRAELADGRLAEPTVTHSGRSTWVRIAGAPPTRLIDETGTEVEIPGESG
jgi:hypothetical protein